MKLEKIEYFAKGQRGIVSTAILQGKKVIVKSQNPKAKINTIEQEAQMLQLVNEYGIGPKFLGMVSEGLVREFVDGVEIIDWIEQASVKKHTAMLVKILDQCRVLDKIGVNKREMTRPYKHILVENGEPVQIDFERAHKSAKPQNVTQLCQWLAGSRMTQVLRGKGIKISREKMIVCAKAYKKTYDDEAFAVIRQLVCDGNL